MTATKREAPMHPEMPVKIDRDMEEEEGYGEGTVATFTEDSETLSVSDFSTSSRRVSFGPIQVREFERIVGDKNLDVIGVPLSIGWGYHERKPVSIERFESDRIRKENLRMSSITRKNILHNVFGISEEELRSAENEVKKIRKSREQSKKIDQTKDKVKSKFKTFKKIVRKALTADALVKGITAAASAGMVMPMSH